MAWSVSLDPRALAELKKLDQTAQRRIVRFLQERLEGDINPRESGKAPKGDKVGVWRNRIGAYRVICRIDDQRSVILVLRIAHRREVYR